MNEFITVDRMIQTYVMGWEGVDPLFSPTTDVKDAMKVEEELYKKGFHMLVTRCSGNRCRAIDEGWAVEGDFFCNVMKENDDPFKVERYKSVASTFQEAICFSALKAMGVNLIQGK